MPSYAKRVDNTSKALIAHAKSIGFDYEPAGASFDGVLAWGRDAFCVDWKSHGARLTPSQQRMVARGFPVKFISKAEQLDQLKAELMR